MVRRKRICLGNDWNPMLMKPVLRKWVWRMALRDARRGLKPLLLSMLCVILGVASVVTAFSFRDNLQSSIRTQSKSLLGADLAIDSREPFSSDPEAHSAICASTSLFKRVAWCVTEFISSSILTLTLINLSGAFRLSSSVLVSKRIP